MHPEILRYNQIQEPNRKKVCDLLAREIDRNLPEAENKIWHAHPVWFLDGNPTVGYSSQKLGIRLMFWSGADFDEEGLNVVGKRFKDASVFYNLRSRRAPSVRAVLRGRGPSARRRPAAGGLCPSGRQLTSHHASAPASNDKSARTRERRSGASSIHRSTRP